MVEQRGNQGGLTPYRLEVDQRVPRLLGDLPESGQRDRLADTPRAEQQQVPGMHPTTHQHIVSHQLPAPDQIVTTSQHRRLMTGTR